MRGQESKMVAQIDIKLYGKWTFQGVQVTDMGLNGYLNIVPIIAPRTNGYYHNTAFYKTKVNIIERLMNRLQVCGHKGKKHKFTSGHNTGKAKRISTMMEEVLETLEKRTKQNPIQVIVTAIENAAPREEIITIEYGGARYPKAVECAPQRRIDIALRYFTQGSYHKAFNTKKPFVQYLADEIIAAYQSSSTSVAIAKKNELERQSDSSR